MTDSSIENRPPGRARPADPIRAGRSAASRTAIRAVASVCPYITKNRPPCRSINDQYVRTRSSDSRPPAWVMVRTREPSISSRWRAVRNWYVVGTAANDVAPLLTTSSQKRIELGRCSVRTVVAPTRRWVLSTERPYECRIGNDVIARSAEVCFRAVTTASTFAVSPACESMTACGLPVVPDVPSRTATSSAIAPVGAAVRRKIVISGRPRVTGA